MSKHIGKLSVLFVCMFLFFTVTLTQQMHTKPINKNKYKEVVDDHHCIHSNDKLLRIQRRFDLQISTFERILDGEIGHFLIDDRSTLLKISNGLSTSGIVWLLSDLPKSLKYLKMCIPNNDVNVLFKVFDLIQRHLPNLHFLIIESTLSEMANEMDAPIVLPNLKYLAVRAKTFEIAKQLFDVNQIQFPNIDTIYVELANDVIWTLGPPIELFDMHRVNAHSVLFVRKNSKKRSATAIDGYNLKMKSKHFIGAMQRLGIPSELTMDVMGYAVIDHDTLRENQLLFNRHCKEFHGVFEKERSNAIFALSSLRGIDVPNGINMLYFDETMKYYSSDFQAMHFPKTLRSIEMEQCFSNWKDLIGFLHRIRDLKVLKIGMSYQFQEEFDKSKYDIKPIELENLEELSIHWHFLEPLIENGLIHLPNIKWFRIETNIKFKGFDLEEYIRSRYHSVLISISEND